MTIKKVLFQLNQLGYGGTEKVILTLSQLMDRSKFDPYLFYLDSRGSAKYYRLKLLAPFSSSQKQRFKTIFTERFAREEAFKKAFQGQVYHGNPQKFLEAIEQVQPDIIHLNRGEEIDFYTSLVPEIPKKIKIVETSIFGKGAPSAYLDRMDQIFFISQWLEKRSPWAQGKSKILYNPILTPQSSKNLRSELGISEDQWVIGRASRPDLDHDQFLEKVYSLIPDYLLKKVVFLCLGSRPKYSADFTKRHEAQMKSLTPTTDEARISQFYNSLDVFTHRRPEGESFGLVIAEAMIHGVPVITHLSPVDNAQSEVLGNPEYVSEYEDPSYYAKKLVELLENESLRKSLGKSQAERSMNLFSAGKIIKDLETSYSQLF